MGKLLKVFLMPHPPIMVEEVGRGGEREVEETIKSSLEVGSEIKDLQPGTIVVIVPPHGPAFSDAVSINAESGIKGDLGKFGAPQVKFEYEIDLKLVDLILKKSAQNDIPIAPIDRDSSKRYRISNSLDHGSMVPLYFVDKKYKNFKLVVITYGMLSNEELYKFGKVIRESVEESQSKVVLITSGDLSHRLTHDAPAGFSPYGAEFDKVLVEYLKSQDTESIMEIDKDLIERAGECGYRSILVMLGALDGLAVEGKVLSYEGPFGVGYCVASYEIKGKDDKNSKVEVFYRKRDEKINEIRMSEDIYVKLARESLEYFIKTGKVLGVADGLPQELTDRRAGTFVSIKKHNQLRGCIGTIEAVHRNIAEEIIENAISAGNRDPRFYPVEEDELAELVYSVDVLDKPESIETKEKLDTKRYGVIVRKGRRSGLLLPNLEGVDTIDEQLRIVLNKAGIDEDEDYSMERFEVIRHR